MKLPTQTPRISQRAFTLVEILTAVAITTIIVFTLVKMFDTSTKALQVANRQTDIWESARATFGVLRQNIGEVVAGESLERISLFSANAAVEPVGGVDFRRQDIFVLSREGSKWQVSVYLLGNDRESDPASVGVKTLYRYQTNYPVYPFAGGAVLGIDHPILDTRHPFTHALDALDRHLDDLANLREPDPSISVMARGILHLRLVPYASDGRAFTNRNLLPVPPPLPVDHFVDADTMRFQGDMLPASVDLEMFVLEPDRLEEYRTQSGPIAQKNYLDQHVNSVQLFRTRIPIRRDLLARQ